MEKKHNNETKFNLKDFQGLKYENEIIKKCEQLSTSYAYL